MLEKSDRIEIEDDYIADVDRVLNRIGRIYRHMAMRAGATRMVHDEFGRRLGFWKAGSER